MTAKIQRKSATKTIPAFEVIKLWTRAGGRCEFNGCNDYLLTDKLTLHEANFSNIAHIVGRSSDGPRGNDPLPLLERNKAENLMLLCTKCHKLVDAKKLVSKYPKELLLQYKQEHEDRVLELTSVKPGNKTVPILFKSKIAGEVVEIPFEHIRAAIHPRYPADQTGILIDLTDLPSPDDEAYYIMGAKKISQAITSAYQPAITGNGVFHFSVFGLGPMPLLVHLGCCLSNKIETELYQRHRDTQQWSWKTDEKEPIKYVIRELQKGTNQKKIALVLPLSGPIDVRELPKSIDKNFTVYEIALADRKPNPMYLNTRQSLLEFQKIYQQFLRELKAAHGDVEEIHLFPAVPAPVAIACGRELLLKIDPALVVYDKTKEGFNLALKVQKT